MKKSSNIKISLLFLLMNLMLCGSIFAQNEPNAAAKRNSPFSPNPKKRESSAIQSKTTATNNSVEEKTVIIIPASQTIEPATEITTPKAEETENFESRSVAKKTLEIVKRSSAAAVLPTETYKIGVGDVLDIKIANTPSSGSSLFTVLENGAIDFPLAGSDAVPIAGMNVDEIGDLLREKIKLFENPNVSVTVRDYASHTITVLGLVERPGAKALRREAIPLYVILAEAMPQNGAAKAMIVRSADKKTEIVSLENSETLIYPNDIVRVVGASSAQTSAGQFYFIGGEINAGGQKDFHEGLTLTQAILASGGVKKESIKKVTIRRKNAEGLLVPASFDLKAIRDGKTPDPVLEIGDTVEVGK